MLAAVTSVNPFLSPMADELRKVGGFPVLVESTRKMGPAEIRSRQAVTSVEEKEPAAELYEVPAGFTERPFDPMAHTQAGLPGAP